MLPSHQAIAWTSETAVVEPAAQDSGAYDAIAADVATIKEWISRELDLVHFSRLEDDWDGFGADPPDPLVVQRAIQFLQFLRERSPGNPPLRANVSPSGSIALEWRENVKVIRAEIEDSPDVEWMIVVPGRPTEFATERFSEDTEPSEREQAWQPAPTAVDEPAYAFAR